MLFKKTSRFLSCLIGAVYVLLAFAKFILISQATGGKLDFPDSVFPFFTLRQLLTIGALSELCIGAICFFNKNTLFSWLCISSFSMALIGYRFMDVYLGSSMHPCMCMGFLTDIFHISARIEKIFTLSFLIICMPVSFFFINKEIKNKINNKF